MGNLNKYIRLSLIALIAVILISVVLSFAGCGEKDPALNFGSYDRLEIDGYYLKPLNSVESNGVVLEKNYYVCSDEELANVVGALTARSDEDGELAGYEAAITQSDGQRVISFSKSKESSSYTNSLYSDDYSRIISTLWESIAIRWDSKERLLSKGTVDYYSNGVENNYSEEQYLVQNGKEYLSCTIERKRNEDGSLASEKTIRYDESGEIKQ